MNLLLFGPPGSGKGTQAALLVERLQYRHISTGEVLRNAMRDGTPLGLQVKEIVRRGDLVPDESVSALVREIVLADRDESTRFLFDGYPRTLRQVEDLTKILEEARRCCVVAVALQVDDEQVVERLSGRRQCKKCGAVYHIQSHPPRQEGTCDTCGGEVAQRPDDTPETIRERLRVYERETRPVLDAYANRGQLSEVPGVGDPEEVYTRIMGALEVECG